MCLGSRVKVPSRQLPKAAAAIPQFAWFSWAEEAPICFLALSLKGLAQRTQFTKKVFESSVTPHTPRATLGS